MASNWPKGWPQLGLLQTAVATQMVLLLPSLAPMPLVLVVLQHQMVEGVGQACWPDLFAEEADQPTAICWPKVELAQLLHQLLHQLRHDDCVGQEAFRQEFALQQTWPVAFVQPTAPSTPRWGVGHHQEAPQQLSRNPTAPRPKQAWPTKVGPSLARCEEAAQHVGEVLLLGFVGPAVGQDVGHEDLL